MCTLHLLSPIRTANKDADPSHREPAIESDSPAISCGTQIARARHVRSRRRSKFLPLALVTFAARATYTARARSASLRVAPHQRARVATITRWNGRPLRRVEHLRIFRRRGYGSGLASPGLGGSLLRRGIPPPDEARCPPGAKNTQLAELIPRFLRLSALVALELGREVGDYHQREDEAQKRLVPTAEWYLLLAGLLTCAVLEGYLTAGWTGLAPVQVLLGVGLGSAVNPEASPPTRDDEYDEFEPDDMPDLPNAVSVLFPSWSVNHRSKV
jgi:hypothetical protein